jgi:hypothetical protein
MDNSPIKYRHSSHHKKSARKITTIEEDEKLINMFAARTKFTNVAVIATRSKFWDVEMIATRSKDSSGVRYAH